MSHAHGAPGGSGGSGVGHGHSHGSAPRLRVGRVPRTVLLVFLLGCAAATVVGGLLLFPHGDQTRPSAQYAAPGVTFPDATVERVRPTCGGTDPDAPPAGTQTLGSGSGQDYAQQCAELRVRLDEGASRGDRATVQVGPEIVDSGLRSGDKVELLRIPAQAGLPATYTFFGVDRRLPIAVMSVLFVLVVAAVARWRGLLALVGLVISGLVVGRFMLPALLQGGSGVAVALVGASAIMFVVLYLAHGVSLRTSTALAGTLLGIAVTTLLGLFAVTSARLSGVGDDASGMLSGELRLNFQGLLMCAIIVAALGVLNDVTITQASAVWELRAAAPQMSRRSLFGSGMRIGRDHIASTIYTIVFAYTGAALAVLLLLSLYDRPLLDLLSSENIAEEIMRTLAGAIGLVLAVPITTAIAVLTVAEAQPVDGLADGEAGNASR